MPYLGVFLVRRIHDGRAADLCHLLPPAVERPHADLIGGRHVLDEEHPVAEPETQLVEHLQVLQHVIVGGTGGKTTRHWRVLTGADRIRDEVVFSLSDVIYCKCGTVLLTHNYIK